MSRYLERAEELRASIIPHYNCGQSVVLPFAEDVGMTEEQADAICANFGGGLNGHQPAARSPAALLCRAFSASMTRKP